jgi:hypothetical protein
MGPLMTRTLLNWSELLGQYRGRSIQKQPRLKKWSEMDDLDAPPGRYIKRYPVYSGEFISRSESLTQDPLPTTAASQQQDIEDDTESELEENKSTEATITKENPDNGNIIGKKVPLSEIFFNIVGQDTESIPSLAEANQLESEPQKKLSEHDSLLIDLLEMNLRSEW